MKSDQFRTKSSFFSCQNDVLVDQNVVLVDQNVVLFHQNDVLAGLRMAMSESGLHQPGEPGWWGGGVRGGVIYVYLYVYRTTSEIYTP